MLQVEIKAMIDNAPFFMYALDTDMCLINANKTFFDVYAKLLDKAPQMGDKMPLTSQQPIKKRLEDAYLSVLEGEELHMEDEIGRKENNTQVWFRLHLSPIKENEKIIGILAIAWDISEKKKNENRLADWERKYKELMNQANDAIFWADLATGNLIYANEKAQNLVGKPLAELLKMHHSELHPERFRDEYAAFFKEFANTGQRAKQFFLVLHKNGTEIPVDISSGTIEYKGKMVMQGIFRDMSRHMEAQHALEKQKEFYETILNHIPIDVAVLDEEDKYTYLNPKAVKDPELRKWLLGKKILDYYQYRNLDPKRGELKQSHLDYIRRNKMPTKWEDYLQDKQGKEMHLLRRFTPIHDEAGDFRMSLFTGENITYLKQAQQQLLSSEQRYRNLVETTSDWIWETNVEGKFTYSSPQVYDILGYTPKEVIGKSVMHFTTNASKEGKWQMFKNIWATGDNFLLDELEYQHKNGRVVLLQTSGAPIYNNKWELTNYRGIARDVTSQKGAEHLLQNTLRELKDRNFELDSFVYKVSHDLRAPLSSILGLLNLMQNEQNIENMYHYVSLMQDRAQKLDNFIKTVLAYSQNLNQHIAPQEINFEKIIIQCFDELQYMPSASKMNWKLQIEGNAVFCTDEFRLIIIFKNFISNAIKYQKTNQDESLLDIRIQVTEEAATITIQDEGIGIEAEFLPRVFDMFYRATEKSEGSGLGLYIVRQALDKIQGKVQIESIYNQGTTIFLKIPNKRQI